MKIENLKVRTRLIVGFGLVLAMLFTISVLGILRLDSMNGTLSQTVDLYGNAANLIGQALGDVRVGSMDVRNMVGLREPAPVAAQSQKIAAGLDDYDAVQKKIQGLFDLDPRTSESEKKYLQEISSLSGTAIPLARKAIQAASGDPQNADATAADAGASLDALGVALYRFWDHEVKASNESAIEAHEAYIVSRRILLFLSVTSVLLAAVICLAITRSLMKQLGGEPSYAAFIAEQISAGDLTGKIDLASGDTASLLHSMSLMRDKLQLIVERIRAGTDSIATASGQIAAGNADLSARTEEQAASLEETAASMTQLTETVRLNADNARHANSLATRATEVADNSNNIVGYMVQTIEKINDSSKLISDITSVIEGIAFQTNILALNAAVEAARAGEQGRGFAVVASEVRSLAQRSAGAAREINELISSSVILIQDGTRQAGDVNSSMSQVVSAIRQVSAIVGEISNASDEQSRGIEQISAAVVQMDHVTQQNAALVEQSAAVAQSFDVQTKGLSDAVSVFRLAGTT
ncbi:methyl-accepting chemotaxis sensory transducer [Burkholderia lata]|uniref:Methyl-accepting chemotaxis sensory transducer n=1 Tax=Burkholderia lata (strain ATCC 17760 / DSM 23089 / LMG 22485 / NCIMB 9086 / R18194 / 383) TaxID=482957 RepID=A0A6P2V9Y1_BURL3|nr:methyl-accepting chemotaxis protein [Burkholderia lata]VWC77026.1 methyl-accepting chemotaxis sensory transducer [Burkholderia lata]